MVDAVINIVNEALGRAALTPLQPTAYDTSYERNPLWLRNEFNRAYRKLADYQKEDFKTYFDITTTAGVNEYALPVASRSNKFINDVMYLNKGVGNDIPIYYIPEDEVLRQYSGDLTEIESGEPYGFFLQTHSTANVKKLSFILKPDAIYSIRGYYYQDSTALTGVSLTACSNEGDEYLRDHLYAFLMFNLGKMEYQDSERFKRDSEMKYICTDLGVNTIQRGISFALDNGIQSYRNGVSIV